MTQEEYNDVLYLVHHGIKGQKWGKQNGPPYPLSGGQMTSKEKKNNRKLYLSKKNKSAYNKKYGQITIQKGQTLSTLSYDKDRTKKGDMFYAAYDKYDKHEYNALFNKKMPQPIYDSNGTNIGTGNFYKYRINNSVGQDIKVANEEQGIEAFAKLYSESRDFYNFVNDPNRMQSKFVDDKYKFKGYRESKNSLENIRNNEIANYEDIEKAYRMFNYIIPNEDKDTVTQRARFFNQLKKSGYGAVLDTNDALYGGFKANSPVIVFDQTNIVSTEASRVTYASHEMSVLVFAGHKALNM